MDIKIFKREDIINNNKEQISFNNLNLKNCIQLLSYPDDSGKIVYSYIIPEWLSNLSKKLNCEIKKKTIINFFDWNGEVRNDILNNLTSMIQDINNFNLDRENFIYRYNYKNIINNSKYNHDNIINLLYSLEKFQTNDSYKSFNEELIYLLDNDVNIEKIQENINNKIKEYSNKIYKYEEDKLILNNLNYQLLILNEFKNEELFNEEFLALLNYKINKLCKKEEIIEEYNKKLVNYKYDTVEIY